MQNFTVPKLIAATIAIASVFFLTSCLNDVDNSRPTQFQIGMEIQNFDSTFTVGDDSMNVNNVRFLVGDFGFETETDSLYLNENTPIMRSFQSQATGSQNSRNPQTLAGGQFPDNTYQSIYITFPRAPENGSNNIDTDFTADGKRYTIIAKGTYNGSEFTYKSERIFNKSFPLSLSTIPEEDAFFGFLIQTDVRDWFMGGQGLLDPSDSANSPQINDNIEQSFQFKQESNLGNQSL